MNNPCRTAQRHARGAALLIILTLLILAGTTALVMTVSINEERSKRTAKSTQILQQAKDALLAYAITQNPAGRLPCPDTDGDGLANPAAGGCQQLRGQLPFRSLGIAELWDSSGTRLWYAVERRYTPLGGSPLNSSQASSLTLDNAVMAAIVIAPGAAIETQQRSNLNVANYLEGVNADANPLTFARGTGDTQNDQLLGIPLGEFWTLMEKRVLAEVHPVLDQYAANCGEFPWAASFGVSGFHSLANTQEGHLPTGNAAPQNWNSGCASGVDLPAWVKTHWAGMLYYSMCTAAQGDCLTLSGDSGVDVRALLIAPGVPLAGQNRGNNTVTDFFEGDNAAVGSPFEFRHLRNFAANFNDVLLSVSP